MKTTWKDQVLKMVEDAYQRGNQDAFEGIVEGFQAIKKTGRQAMSMDEIITGLLGAKQAIESRAAERAQK